MSNCTNNFIKRVIGVTRTFKWTVTTNGAAVPLVAEDLTLQLVPPRGEAVSLPFDVDDNIVSFTWQGDDQHIIGCYSLILWANYGEDNQRRVDIHNFVELIPWSNRQSGEYSDLVEESIELETADFGENIMVVDNLNSTSATDALSANMGRQLNVTKQDVIQDLATIRSGAAAGAAVKEWAKNDPLITDDATQVSASKLAFNGNIFEQWVPGIASSIGLKGIAGFLKVADISQWDSAYNDRMLPTVAAVKAKLQAVLTALATIEAVIPSQASSTNKLTDKGYVDGAIATNTANFVGTFDSLAELQAVQNPTKNDYGFVIETDAQGNEYYDRYKYTGTQWLYEYKVESTPFTAEQWAAIQSGITAALVSKLSALPTNAELNTALASKQPVINDLDTIRAGAAAGATAYQKPSGGIPKTDLASGVQASLDKADAAAPQSTTYTKAEVDAALALKQTSSQLATINGSRIDQGGNVTIVAAEGQTITIDAAPTAGSSNAVSSGGVYPLVQELNGLAPLTEYVGRLESTSAKISNVSTYRYMVVPVKPSDVVKLTAGTGGCFYYVVSGFTFNPTLPYDLILATGETSKHNANEGVTITYTMPSDAAYIILRGTIALLSINDRDVLKSLSGLIQETNGRVDKLTGRVDYVDIGVSQKFDGIIGNQFVGDLTSAKTIVTGATKKYVVISVKGGQVFNYKRTANPATIFYVVSEFMLNPALPYNLVLATGETTYHSVETANYEYSLTIPSDAKYILMISEVSGVDYIPEHLTLDGVNVLIPYTEELGLSKKIDASQIREEEGFYRSVSPYRYSAVEGYYATPLIPVYPGDIIETNTTVNAPYNTVGHLCFDGDGAFVQVLQMVNGKTEITQAMVDAGVRFVGISFVKADTPTPSVIINRQKLAEMSVQISDTQEKAQENETAISAINGKCRILVKKNGSLGFDVEVYNKRGNKVKYHFSRYLKVWDSLEYVDGEGHTQTKTNFTSADMWGNDAIYKDNTYIIQGNSNFICQVYGDTRHIGDQHGNEVLKVCKFFADGVEFDPLSLSTALECHELRWEWKSEVYSPNLSGTNVYTGAYPRFDTDGNPIVNYTHYMMGTLNDANEIKLDNRLCIKQDGLKFNAAFGAMLECNYGDFSQVSVATKESTINSIANDGTATAVFSDITLSDNPNQLANKAVMRGTDFVVEQSIEIANGTPNVHCEFYTNRLKVYFMPVKGDTFKAEQWEPDEFNAGDQIRVLTYRKIEI